MVIMRKFLKKALKAVVFFSILVVGVCFVLHLMLKILNTYDKDCVFIWGDSQMYQGFDNLLLDNKLNKQVLTSAYHGMGIYDFLVSQKSIPDNAICVVSFPEGAFFRNPLSDNNRTGLEIDCLQELYLSGCSEEECVRILKLNRRIHSVFYKAYSNSCHKIYPFANSLVYPEPLPLWHSLFENPKDWFPWKAKAYVTGIQHLFDKHSQIILIQFPFDEQVESFAQNSINRQLSDSLKFELIDRFAMKYDTVVLHSDSLLMHDLSHMNEVGARMLTCRIADSLREDTINNRFFTVVIE